MCKANNDIITKVQDLMELRRMAEELQAEILAKLSANGPLTDRMKREVRENVYRDSLLNWVKSFR